MSERARRSTRLFLFRGKHVYRQVSALSNWSPRVWATLSAINCQSTTTPASRLFLAAPSDVPLAPAHLLRRWRSERNTLRSTVWILPVTRRKWRRERPPGEQETLHSGRESKRAVYLCSPARKIYLWHNINLNLKTM